MGLFSLAGACRLNHKDRRHGRTARLALLRHQPADLLCRARHRRSGHRARLLASGRRKAEQFGELGIERRHNRHAEGHSGSPHIGGRGFLLFGHLGARRAVQSRDLRGPPGLAETHR